VPFYRGVVIVAGKKVVRGLYNYEPSTDGGNESIDDLCFSKGDYMIVIRE